MNYRLAIIALSLSAPLQAFAEETAGLYPTSKATEAALIEDVYFSSNPELSTQEQASVGIADRWRSNNIGAAKPIESPGGIATFVFGASQPSVVCAPFQVCDIELQKGEVLNSLDVGDQVRFNVTPTLAGTGQDATVHLIVKPLDVGVETSLIAATNRRTYHITLRSHRDKYMPRVAFSYAEDSSAEWSAYFSRNKQSPNATAPVSDTAHQTPEYLGELDFNYRVQGDAAFTPVRVFNDGRKTIIQMPDDMHQSEAPTLLVLRGKNSMLPWGRKEQEVLVNYRVHAGRMIVDAVFDKAVLIAGVGDDQDRVVIERSGK